MAKITVLGAGLVGGVMAEDLAKDHDVSVVDISEESLSKLKNVKTICSDITKTENLHKSIKSCDL
jgi:saccharopine dehydrogenase-like NADP-dependent oxidoreductase